MTATTCDRTADTDAPILDVLAERWSTRVFDAASPIDEDALTAALEAARWAPSASNSQPWRAVIARRGGATHADVVASLVGFNQAWAGDAAALVVIAAETVRDDGSPLRWAEYDAGQAAAHFTVQAHTGGLSTHQMGGFDPAQLRAALDLPTSITPLTVIAVGAAGDPASATPEIRQRETAPRVRRAVAESVLLDD